MAMPSFLTKLFRRRSSPTAAENGGANGGTDQRKFKKQSGRKTSGDKNGVLIRKNNSPSDGFKNGGKISYSGTGGKANSSSTKVGANDEPENGGGVLSPRNTQPGSNVQPVGQEHATQKPAHFSSLGGGLPTGLETPTFDNDGDPAFSDENTNRSNVQDSSKAETSSSTLSYQHLRQFELEQRRQPYVMPEPHQLYSTPALEQKMQFNRLSNGQLVGQNPGNSSPVSSSDFCLSTDAEDVEYNAVRNGRGPPPLPNSAGKYSLSHGNSSPMSFTTDDDNSHLFPALEDDNSRFGASVNSGDNKAPDATAGPATAASRFWNSLGGQNGDHVATAEAGSNARAVSPRTAAIREAEKLKKIPTDLYPDSSDSENEGPNPSAVVGRKTQSARFSKKPQSIEPVSTNFASLSSPAEISVFSSLSGPTPAQPDQTSVSSKPVDFMDPAIEDFADFENVKFPSVDESGFFTTEDQNGGGSRPLLLVETSTGREQNQADAVSSPFSSSFVPQSKQSRRSRRQNGQASSSSVNSAPAITASYLRQHHKLGSSSKSISEDPFSATATMNFSSSRLPKESASEALSGQSASADPEIAAVAAKEKLRRRRKARESTDILASPVGLTSPKSTTSSKSRKNRAKASRENDDDEGSDNGEAESWLFDEVTGALGPRGVAADLESLSGRSNRSKSSTGNKSHKSHRSHRSHKSKSRRHRSSNESSDSRSRTSRYSHKSVRSSMSHMSEQSRSVANDLLRLEMQLAMVGSQNNVEGAEHVAGSVGGGGDLSIGTTSLGGTSRASRTSRSTSRRSAAMAKRSKITVIAPPGKLGIILANKTDSKGTVVSGVRTSSVLAEKISPGDRIVAIDGEDVSRMTVSEITTIMARKSEFERILTVMTAPKHHALSLTAGGSGDHFSAGMNGIGVADGESLGGSSVTSGTYSYNRR